jgi:DNA-directed RNA polymerase I subunit RPA12
VTTRTKPSDFPSALRQKLSIVQTVERHQVQTERIDANTECPKCGKIGIRYSEVQQRSADEGSTIIYNCDCGERCGTLTFMAGYLLTSGLQMVYEQLKPLAI